MAESGSGVIYQESKCYRFRSPDGEPYLIGSKCRCCGYVAFPPRVICPDCVIKGSMEEIDLGSTAKIDTFSVLYVGTLDFPAPYILAYVVVPEGARVLSLITGCEPSEEALEIGTPVELVIEKIRTDKQGNEVRGYKFRPLIITRNGV